MNHSVLEVDDLGDNKPIPDFQPAFGIKESNHISTFGGNFLDNTVDIIPMRKTVNTAVETEIQQSHNISVQLEHLMTFEQDSLTQSTNSQQEINHISAPLTKPSITFTDILHQQMVYNIAVMSNSRTDNTNFIKSLMKVRCRSNLQPNLNL